MQRISFPTVGYTVFWRLAGIEVTREELERIMADHGIDSALPTPPTPRVALRRALTVWIGERARAGGGPALAGSDGAVDESGEGGSQRALIRVINQRSSDYLVFALIAEHVDLAGIGLSYGTDLRLFLHKKKHTLLVTTDAIGNPDAVAEARAVAAQLEPHWLRHRAVYQSSDLSRTVRDLVADLDAVSLRDGGGVYFVPPGHEAALENLDSFLRALPTNGTRSPCFMAIPQVDEAATRRQLALTTHQGFLDELAVMERDLSRFVEQAANGKVKEKTIRDRLLSYRALKGRAGTYADLLGMQQEGIEAQLAALEARARSVLDIDIDADADADDSPETDAPVSVIIDDGGEEVADDVAAALWLVVPAAAPAVRQRRVA